MGLKNNKTFSFESRLKIRSHSTLLFQKKSKWPPNENVLTRKWTNDRSDNVSLLIKQSW